MCEGFIIIMQTIMNTVMIIYSILLRLLYVVHNNIYRALMIILTGWPCKAVLHSDERDERGTDTLNTEMPPLMGNLTGKYPHLFLSWFFLRTLRQNFCLPICRDKNVPDIHNTY